MRTLVANIPLPSNRFLVDLNEALTHYVDLVHDHEAFWNMEGDFDVVHLHFPEYLTYELQSAYQGSLTRPLIDEVERRLKYWSERSALVITRHVLLPHDARTDPVWIKFYETIYRYVHGVVHFADPSIEEFQIRYAASDFVHGPPKHRVVPHHNYASLPNCIGRKAARDSHGISANAKVMLVFGAIRNEEERQLILSSFRQMRINNKLLLVSNWRENLANISWIRLRYWLRNLTRWYYKLHPHYQFNYGFVEEEDVQRYLNAADVLFIPRFHVLNSGNVTLGMTFAKVIVGPDSLDVGYLLKSSGNVVFDPDRPKSAVAAIENAMNLAQKNEIGLVNQQVALSQWSVNHCAEQYLEIYKELMQLGLPK